MSKVLRSSQLIARQSKQGQSGRTGVGYPIINSTWYY